MKKVINEKVKNVSFYTVNKDGVKTLLKSSDISYLYFDWKKIFGISEQEIGHDYTLTKTLLKALKKTARKVLIQCVDTWDDISVYHGKTGCLMPWNT